MGPDTQDRISTDELIERARKLRGRIEEAVVELQVITRELRHRLAEGDPSD